MTVTLTGSIIKELSDKALRFQQMTEDEKKEFLDSPEWKTWNAAVERNRLKCYTVIYRDMDGELREAWHTIAESSIEYVKDKYKNQKRDIVHFVPKELPFGQYLKIVKRKSKK